MTTGLRIWSKTAASNNSADSAVNWAEGMAPSAVNNSARAEMASAAKWRDDNSGTLLTSGSTSAYTVTSNQVSTGYLDGDTISVLFHATNDASATLNVDSVGAKQLQIVSGTNVSAGAFKAGTSHRFHYSSSSTAWIAQGGDAVSASGISSSQIADGSVAYSKIQTETAGTLLGNGGSTAAAPAELTIGQGLVATPNSISAPAFPPTSSFKNLVLKVTGTSSATVTADFVTMATSGSSNFNTLPLSANINFGTNGAADALDAGSLSAGTWYAIYAIATTTSTAAHGLASTSFTTPAMPSGYTYKARIGALVTSTSTASAQLMGTWQFGRKANYVVGLAATTIANRTVKTSTHGDVSTPTYVGTSVSGVFVPTTASIIRIQGYFNANTLLAAPSTGYGTATSSPPPIAVAVGGGLPVCYVTDITLESSNIYSASTGSLNTIYCYGWEDNL